MRIVRLAAVVILVLLVASPVRGAEPDDVAAALENTGVYVEPGAAVSERLVGEHVATMRNEGELASIAVLSEEPLSGATAFADALFARLGEGMILVVAPQSVGVAGETEVFTPEQVDAAVEVALDETSDADLITTFVAELTGTGEEPTGGGSSFLVWVVLIGGGVAAFLWWRSRRRSAGQRIDPRLAEAKAAVQQQIDAVANDIIELEDEVAGASDARVREFYGAAAATYNEVTGAYASAATPEALLALTNKLDEAIWQLDTAEALLDGKPLPERPEPQRLPTPSAGEPAGEGRPEEEPAPLPDRSPAGDASGLPPRPEYDRRDTRRSSYGGGGLFDILAGMAGAMMAGRMMRTSTGRRPPAPTYPKIDLGSPSSSRPRRTGTSRVRTGGRRRG